MSRNPAAHRLVTKKRRQEQSWRRSMYRVPLRYVTGVDTDTSPEEWAEAMANAPLMVLPEPSFSMGRQMPAEYQRHVEPAEAPFAAIRDSAWLAKDWAEHPRRIGQAHGVSLNKNENEGA